VLYVFSVFGIVIRSFIGKNARTRFSLRPLTYLPIPHPVDNPHDIQALVFGKFTRNNKRRFQHNQFVYTFHSSGIDILFPFPAALPIVALIRFIASAWGTVLPNFMSAIPHLMPRIVWSSVTIRSCFDKVVSFLAVCFRYVEHGN
jgi:hypothetical protein